MSYKEGKKPVKLILGGQTKADTYDEETGATQMSIILFLSQGNRQGTKPIPFLLALDLQGKKAKPSQSLNSEGSGCLHLWRQILDEEEKLAEGMSAILQKSSTTKIQV